MRARVRHVVRLMGGDGVSCRSEQVRGGAFMPTQIGAGHGVHPHGGMDLVVYLSANCRGMPEIAATLTSRRSDETPIGEMLV